MKMTLADPKTKEWFREFAGAYPQLELRPMFGHVAAFVRSNGQMTAGTYGAQMNLRMSDTDRAEFMKSYQAEVFEPMPGRPMREYVVVPDAVRGDEALLRGWLERSIDYSAGLPPKKRK